MLGGRFGRESVLQVLLGLGSQGQVQLTELLSPLHPIQMLKLARTRWEHFAAIEVWDDAVCVLRLPPTALESGRSV